MPRLWLVAGSIYILAGISIILDHALRFSQQWNWDEFLHHEAFFRDDCLGGRGLFNRGTS